MEVSRAQSSITRLDLNLIALHALLAFPDRLICWTAISFITKLNYLGFSVNTYEFHYKCFAENRFKSHEIVFYINFCFEYEFADNKGSFVNKLLKRSQEFSIFSSKVLSIIR